MSTKKATANASGPSTAELAHAQRKVRRLQRQVANLSHKATESSPQRQELKKALGSGDWQNWIDRDKLINISRNLDQRSPLYSGMLDRFVELAIGSGLRPVGNTKKADAAVLLFMDWANRFADARKMADFGGLQRLAFRSMLCDGDVGGAMLRQRSIQLVESDQICTPLGQHRKPGLIDGVELEEFTGAPIAFNVASYEVNGPTLKPSTRRVPAEFFIFLAHRTRPSMTRGLPLLATGMERLIGLDEYTDAVEVAAKLQAAMALVIKTANPGGARDAMASGSQSVAGSGDNSSDIIENLLGMKPGTLLYLDVDEEANSIQGNQPGTTFDMFVQAICRMVCAGTGVPVEVAMGDYSRANFSVARMAMTQANNAVAPWRSMFARQFCDRIFRWQIAYFLASGQLSGSIDDPELFDIRWQAPARAVIDPVAEATAAKLNLEQNLTTWDYELEARGFDMDVVFEKQADAKTRMAELGITPPTTPGSQTASDQQPAAGKKKDTSTSGDPAADTSAD